MFGLIYCSLSDWTGFEKKYLPQVTMGGASRLKWMLHPSSEDEIRQKTKYC